MKRLMAIACVCACAALLTRIPTDQGQGAMLRALAVLGAQPKKALVQMECVNTAIDIAYIRDMLPDAEMHIYEENGKKRVKMNQLCAPTVLDIQTTLQRMQSAMSIGGVPSVLISITCNIESQSPSSILLKLSQSLMMTHIVTTDNAKSGYVPFVGPMQIALRENGENMVLYIASPAIPFDF